MRDAIAPGTGTNDSQILIKRANTMVVTATAPGFYARRHIFFYELGKLIRLSDGLTSFSDMVTRCSTLMSQHKDPICKAQAPMMYNLLRKILVLPKSDLYDKRKIGEPGMYTIKHISYFMMY